MKAKRVKAWAMMLGDELGCGEFTRRLQIYSSKLQCEQSAKDEENNLEFDAKIRVVPVTILVPYRPKRRKKK